MHAGTFGRVGFLGRIFKSRMAGSSPASTQDRASARRPLFGVVNKEAWAVVRGVCQQFDLSRENSAQAARLVSTHLPPMHTFCKDISKCLLCVLRGSPRPPPPRAGSPTGAAAKALAACQAYDSAAWAAMCANLRSVRSVTEGPCSLPPRAEWESWSLWVGGGRVQPVVTHLPGRGRPPPGLPLRACCHRMLRRWPLQLTPRPTPCEGHD